MAQHHSRLPSILLADENDFHFDHTWWIIAIAISTLCVVYILTEFCLNKKTRYIPSRLMVVRAIFNYIAVIVVLITIRNQSFIKNESDDTDQTIGCEIQGAVVLFSLYMATVYYALICWELFLTLKNPFRAPSSGSVLFHVSVTLICFCIILFVSLIKGFEYREDFQICFIYKRETFNVLNWTLIYIPVFLICIGGFIATWWSVKSLKSTIIDETFELRWLLIKQQTAIITCFTINYILQGINWTILFFFHQEGDAPKVNPYLLSAFFMIAVVFDAITWIIRKYIKQIYNLALSSYIAPEIESRIRFKRAKEITNISVALRKEVITCIIDGLAKSILSNSKQNILSRTESELTSVNNAKSSISDNLIDYGANNNFYHSIDDDDDDDDKMNNDNEEILASYHYPNKIGSKCIEGVIDQYNIDPIGKKQSKVIFTDYAPKVFAYLRRCIYGVDDDQYYKSILPNNDISRISLELIAKFSEGRSGAFFFYTRDMKYLIKTLTENEAQLLLDTLRKYVNYMRNNRKTYLSKYFGLHSIRLYGHCIYFMVNKNIFSLLNKKPDETYDIKGSWIDRHTDHNIADRKLMKDEDLNKKLLLDKNESYGVYKQLEKDSLFLSEVKIMDYSLLLGVYYTKVAISKKGNNTFDDIENDQDDEDEFKNDNDNDNNKQEYEMLDASVVEGPGKYCIGIIDMLQKWNSNKKTERFIKRYIRCKDKDGISCIPPQQYKNRFLDKMIEIGIGYKFRDSTLSSGRNTIIHTALSQP